MKQIYPPTKIPALPFFLKEHEYIRKPAFSAKDVTDIKAEFVADPFLFYENDVWYLFFEVMEADVQIGRIALGTSIDGITWKYEKVLLSESFHFSYPLVFKYDNSYFMMPETYQNNQIVIYEAARFPNDWQYKCCILEGRPFVDSTIFQHNNKWWIISSDISNENTYLFYADDIFGSWHEHSQNPVIRGDSGKARPAGRIFELPGGRLIRTAQKCNERYGQRVRAFEITELNESVYREKEIFESPLLCDSDDDPGRHRVHHYEPWFQGGKWLVASDRMGKENPWCIDFYTNREAYPSSGLFFVPISKITGQNINSDDEDGYFIKNLIEGPGIGFDSTPPYDRISLNSWSTESVGHELQYFDINPEPIILDFELSEKSHVEGLAIWPNRFNVGNSINRFSLQLSATGKSGGLGEKMCFSLFFTNPDNMVVFPFSPASVNFIRLIILSNHGGRFTGGDRVGIHEIAFLKSIVAVTDNLYNL